MGQTAAVKQKNKQQRDSRQQPNSRQSSVDVQYSMKTTATATTTFMSTKWEIDRPLLANLNAVSADVSKLKRRYEEKNNQ